ncbi:site-specific integrase [Deinococcus yavapaiensis]|nr:site-specific integrase [Deinococcus yavapaiensis]
MTLELIPRNVADIVKPERPRDEDAREWTASVWTREEARRFAPVVKEDRWGRLLLMLLHTGMRRGEACALRWANVDFEKRELHVRESLDHKGNVTTPKTAKSRRTLALSDEAHALLMYHREQQQIERAAQGGRWKEHGMVFPSTVGTPQRGDNLRRHFVMLCDQAGLPRIRIHDLRHTFTSLMLAVGAPLTIISEKSGHEDPDFTWKRYGHTYKSEHERWALSLSELTREEA